MTLAFQIRRAHAADLHLLPDIERRADEKFHDLAELGHIFENPDFVPGDYTDLRPSARIWVATADDALCGFAYSYDLDDCRHLGQLSVVPEMQRQGMGSALLGAVIADAQLHHKEGVVLATFVHVDWNAPFYAKQGFEILFQDMMGPELRKLAQRDAVNWGAYSPRCIMGKFF